MTTPTDTTGRLAVWYRRVPATQQPQSAEELERTRRAADALAESVGARIVCEVEATGSPSSPAATKAWASAKREAAAIGARYVIALTPGEVSLKLVDYYAEHDALSARGIELLHEPGTRVWVKETGQLLRTLIDAIEAAQSRERSERARDVWRMRKARQQAEQQAAETVGHAA